MSRNVIQPLGFLLLMSSACTAVPTDATPVTRVAGGTCITAVEFTSQARVKMNITGTCNLKVLGQVTMFATQAVDDAGGMTNATKYTTANGDYVNSTFKGQVVSQTSAEVGFTGVETYVSGSGQFAGVTGSSTLTGSATVNSPTNHNTGQYTTTGSITY